MVTAPFQSNPLRLHSASRFPFLVPARVYSPLHSTTAIMATGKACLWAGMC
eukprot:CAMPEP_0119135332 /NCGR_PEP_ID=MMETSP1310-20130426/19083_1 /TAXON_ID=464262 /ORGANISM="Genus nov. species nov., Strain RCC2339" /LENGTH=50 /DNA_ID=CAMNT_0007126205 /DNA_START=35 /DNA_END=187 /DNA_ORIENTATION=+